MIAIWEERREGYFSFFDSQNRLHIFGDVRFSTDENFPYSARIYNADRTGMALGNFSDLDSAKAAVRQACIDASIING